MVSSPDCVREQFKSLQKEYQQQLPSKIGQISEIWYRLLRWPERVADWEKLHCLLHRLVGSGATFGMRELSETARIMEGYIKDMMASKSSPTAAQQTLINNVLDELKQMAIGPHWQVIETRVYPHIDERIQPRKNIFIGEEYQKNTNSNKLISLIEYDEKQANDLAVQLSCFGYQISTFKALKGLEKAIEEMSPAAVIMDIMWPEGQMAGTEMIRGIQEGRNSPLPVLFISARDDLKARLQAVRAGGAAYFHKPVDMGSLIDKLDSLTARETRDPHRILIVDDESILANYHAKILGKGGMVTEVVTDPMQVMQSLVDFKPELILMDMYMPGCNGLELASVIRQQDAYVSIPIVFLSVETNVEQQLTAMHLGGDEFLTKPIEAQHLIAEVKSRVERSRIVSSFMERDSLTGLLNHTKIKERLSIEVARAKRQQSPLAFAMIDIDCFKGVNDIFGHLIGDRVIKSLSRLLKQRLRKTDTIGRYGGEEFAVILPDTDAKVAAKVLNEIRSGFAKVRQLAQDDHEFSVTFSCGVAAFPEYGDANILNEAADKALYQAKRSGRNQLALAAAND